MGVVSSIGALQWFRADDGLFGSNLNFLFADDPPGMPLARAKLFSYRCAALQVNATPESFLTKRTA